MPASADFARPFPPRTIRLPHFKFPACARCAVAILGSSLFSDIAGDNFGCFNRSFITVSRPSPPFVCAQARRLANQCVPAALGIPKRRPFPQLFSLKKEKSSDLSERAREGAVGAISRACGKRIYARCRGAAMPRSEYRLISKRAFKRPTALAQVMISPLFA